MNKQILTKITAAILTVGMIGTFAACKKDPEIEYSTDEGTTIDIMEYFMKPTEPETTVVTDENGETKVYEIETLPNGEKATNADGSFVTKEHGTAPVGGTVAPDTTKGTTAAPTPTAPPVQPTKPPVRPTNPPVQPTNPPVQPTNPPVQPTNPPSSGVEYTPEVKESIKQELAQYARECGWKEVYTGGMSDRAGDEYDFKPDNYDRRMKGIKGDIRELVNSFMYPEKYINFQWSVERPNSLYIYFA